MAPNTRPTHSLIHTLVDEVTVLTVASSTPSSDRRALEMRTTLYEATVQLAQVPSLQPSELFDKLTILCGRLREDLHPEHRGELLTYLLAESVREDCRRLLISTCPARGKAGRTEP